MPDATGVATPTSQGEAMTTRLRSITGQIIEQRRTHELVELGEHEALNAVCPACSARAGDYCRPGLKVHTARIELRSEELEREGH
jgi:hypothetical protein